MGLDNIPLRYPCRSAQTAVVVDLQDPGMGRIDCAATMDAGGCPWKQDRDADLGTAAPVRGILGAPCWYRGKVGNAALELLAQHGYSAPAGWFYGDVDDPAEGAPNLSVEHCLTLATWMADHAEAFIAVVAGRTSREGLVEAERKAEIEAQGDAYRYAIWWLRWVARRAGGANGWW